MSVTVYPHGGRRHKDFGTVACRGGLQQVGKSTGPSFAHKHFEISKSERSIYAHHASVSERSKIRDTVHQFLPRQPIKHIRCQGQHVQYPARLWSNGGFSLQGQRTSTDGRFALRPGSLSAHPMEQHCSFETVLFLMAEEECFWYGRATLFTSQVSLARVSQHEHPNAHALAQMSTKQRHRMFTNCTLAICMYTSLHAQCTLFSHHRIRVGSS